MKGYQVDIGPANNADGGTSTHPLKIHVGIGIGTLHRVHIGDATQEEPCVGAAERRPLPRREFFVAGQAVVHAGEMEGIAARGEIAIGLPEGHALSDIFGKHTDCKLPATDKPVVISETMDLARLQRTLEAIYALRDREKGQHSWRDEGSLPERLDFMSPNFMKVLTYVDESLALYMSKPSSMPRHDSGLARNPTESGERGSGVNQLRNVSIVFIRFTELSVANLNDPKMLLQAQKIFMTIIGVLRRFNGCLRQFACDDKAASALIVFGLSGFAHERGEEVPAMQAAWEIRSKLMEIVGFGFAIGVTSGVVLYGIVGNDKRADGTCLGAPVNLAARFMTHKLAAGQILCDEGIRSKLVVEMEFSDLGQLHFKGFTPLNVYMPTKRLQQTALKEIESGELFGRKNEMDLISAAVDSWSIGSTVRLAILGRCGVGKSTISTWLKGYLQSKAGDKLIFRYRLR
ncbi:hypothetical protein HK101_011744 [Irineochytrium annulatum]|nr:hypothetical protein HK101_011744 [Irineochytrium annulatum]